MRSNRGGMRDSRGGMRDRRVEGEVQESRGG